MLLTLRMLMLSTAYIIYYLFSGWFHARQAEGLRRRRHSFHVVRCRFSLAAHDDIRRPWAGSGRDDECAPRHSAIAGYMMARDHYTASYRPASSAFHMSRLVSARRLPAQLP